MARRIAVRVCVLAASAVLGGGCSLALSLDGLSGGATAGIADASVEAALAEGAASDAPSAIDGGDGALGVDPCAKAVLCDRFERDAVQGEWAVAFTDLGGKLELDTSTSTSPTKSLLLTIPSGVEPHAELISTGYPNVNHARVTFAMKTEGPGRTMAHMRLELTEGARTAAFDLFSLNDRFVITENVFGTPGDSYAEFNFTGVKVNTWQRWSMELDARTSPQMAIVTLDGVEVVRKPFKNTFAKGKLTVTLGALYAPAGPLKHLSYDDVAIEILP